MDAQIFVSRERVRHSESSQISRASGNMRVSCKALRCHCTGTRESLATCSLSLAGANEKNAQRRLQDDHSLISYSSLIYC